MTDKQDLTPLPFRSLLWSKVIAVKQALESLRTLLLAGQLRLNQMKKILAGLSGLKGGRSGLKTACRSGEMGEIVGLGKIFSFP